ncbi:MAG: Holliday junction resolvase Hjc [Candidatus Micrarchaeia archaeon]
MAFGASQKGSRAERELIHAFSDAGFCVIRAAGSGVNSLSPDLLAFKGPKQFAFESKAHEKESLQLAKEQFRGLLFWQDNTGISTYVAWRRNRLGFRFVSLGLFDENQASFSVSWKKAILADVKLEDLTGKPLATGNENSD